MVRTAVCGAADEGSIPSGHPTTRDECTLATAVPRLRLGTLYNINQVSLRQALLIGGVGGSFAYAPSS